MSSNLTGDTILTPHSVIYVGGASCGERHSSPPWQPFSKDFQMTRQEFRKKVFNRDNHKCVVCGKKGQDAHHILERRLFTNGGYIPDNGVTVCSKCHIKSEQTLISPQELRRLAGIKTRILPKHLYPDYKYDKWGNIIWSDEKRIRGELYHDPSVQKILPNHIKRKFIPYVKYPRTLHVPWSENISDDDKRRNNMDPFKGKEVVITEKRDGDNSSVYWDGYFHARSINGNSHPSQDWLKNYIQSWYWELPEGWRVCGENLYATHSIYYNNLPNFFEVFSIWDDKNNCLSWDETKEWVRLLGLDLVPVLFRGQYEDFLDQNIKLDKEEQEGYVIRISEQFPFAQFKRVVAKFVRKDHNQVVQHNWKMNWDPRKTNKLKEDTR